MGSDNTSEPILFIRYVKSSCYRRPNEEELVFVFCDKNNLQVYNYFVLERYAFALPSIFLFVLNLLQESSFQDNNDSTTETIPADHPYKSNLFVAKPRVVAKHLL